MRRAYGVSVDRTSPLLRHWFGAGTDVWGDGFSVVVFPLHPFSEAVLETEALGAKGAKEANSDIRPRMPEDKGGGRAEEGLYILRCARDAVVKPSCIMVALTSRM